MTSQTPWIPAEMKTYIMHYSFARRLSSSKSCLDGVERVDKGSNERASPKHYEPCTLRRTAASILRWSPVKKSNAAWDAHKDAEARGGPNPSRPSARPSAGAAAPPSESSSRSRVPHGSVAI
jgi:hypothetical protein